MPMTFTPPPGTPSGFTPPPASGASSGFTPPPSGGRFAGSPPPPAPGMPAGFAPPPAAGSAENYVPTKIRFPKWLHVADVFLVIAAVCSGFLLYKAYGQRTEANRHAEAAARAAAKLDQPASTYIALEILYPEKRFLLFKNSRNELMAAVVDAPSDAVVTWNKGITIDKKTSEVSQFQMRKDGTWKYLGEFGHLTEYAKEIVAGNTNVADKNGKIVFEPSMCVGGSWYRLYEDSVPWTMAQSACETLGGHLVTVTSRKEQDFITQMAEDKYLWMGGTYNAKKHQWRWMTDDEPMEFTAWDGAKPDGMETDRMILADGAWLSMNESEMNLNGYLCEWDARQLLHQFEELRKKGK